MTAIGAMRAFTESGVRVPDDVSLIGFDNIPFCELTSPAMTTVDQHARELGALSVRRLLGKDDSTPAPAPTLVPRQSTAPKGSLSKGAVAEGD